MKLINDLAFHIVKQQQRHLVISPWSLMAAILMQNREGISIRQLVKEADWLKRQAYNLGAYVDWPGEMIYHTGVDWRGEPSGQVMNTVGIIFKKERLFR